MSSPQPPDQTLGYLRTCIDNRFVAGARSRFEEHGMLGPTDYWHESYPGGSAKAPDAPVGDEFTTVGENYAVSKGATVFGWQAHIAGCGGLPNETDQQIEARLDFVVARKVEKYQDLPGVRIYKILGTPGGTLVKLVYPPDEPA